MAKSPLHTLEDALSVLRAQDPDGNWSVESTEESWWLLTGDQWVLSSADEQEFSSSVVAVAVAMALQAQ
jgi:hypothetical protein